MWCTPAPPRPSGSSMSSTKLLVPSGGLTHDSCGDTFSPTQFALFGALALLLASFTGNIWPSLKVVDEIVNTFCCALADPPAHANARPIPPASNAFPIDRFMVNLPSVYSQCDKSSVYPGQIKAASQLRLRSTSARCLIHGIMARSLAPISSIGWDA